MNSARPVDAQGRRLVTVDTGESDDVFNGALLTWLYESRGGYGFVVPIDAICVYHSRRPKTWVWIRVMKRIGENVIRRVDAKNLRWRGPGPR